MRRTLSAFALLIFLSAAPSPVSAAPVFLDFEGLADLEVIGALFPDVVFTNAIALQAGAVGGSLNEIDFPPRSGVTAAFDSGGPMRLDFATTIDSFSAYFTYAAPVVVRAFDAADNELASVTSAFAANYAGLADPATPPNELISLATAGISFLTIAGAPSGGSFVIDDVLFNTTPGNEPIPEPASVVLFGTTLAAAACRRWKNRKTAKRAA